jgi:hypothetical protein
MATVEGPLAFPGDITPARLREWAEEHLMYEVSTLVYATAELGNTPEQRSARENTLLESFAVHARCLNDFLWHDRSDKKPRDAFAADFCAPGDWERVRDDLPQTALDDVRTKRRFGREIMHLTYDRIDGDGEGKQWPCGAVVLEVAGALREFATRSLADRLDVESRESLLGLPETLEPDSGGSLADLHIGFITGATGMDARQFRNVMGGTINFREIQAGGSDAA